MKSKLIIAGIVVVIVVLLIVFKGDGENNENKDNLAEPLPRIESPINAELSDSLELSDIEVDLNRELDLNSEGFDL